MDNRSIMDKVRCFFSCVTRNHHWSDWSDSFPHHSTYYPETGEWKDSEAKVRIRICMDCDRTERGTFLPKKVQQ